MTWMRGLLFHSLVALLLAGTFTAAQAADITTIRRVRGHVPVRHFVLLPERHVVEKVMPPYSGNYLINATWFTAMTAACARWVAGDRIRLVAGDWHGACTTAIFRNVSRGMTCELSCR
jgi:hypothetical protein